MTQPHDRAKTHTQKSDDASDLALILSLNKHLSSPQPDLLHDFFPVIDELLDKRPHMVFFTEPLLSALVQKEPNFPNDSSWVMAQKMIQALGRANLEHTQEGISLCSSMVYQFADHEYDFFGHHQCLHTIFPYMIQHLDLFQDDPVQRHWGTELCALMVSNQDLSWHQYFIQTATEGMQEEEAFDTRVRLLAKTGSLSPSSMAWLMNLYPEEMVQVDMRTKSPGVHRSWMRHAAYAEYYQVYTEKQHLIQAIDLPVSATPVRKM